MSILATSTLVTVTREKTVKNAKTAETSENGKDGKYLGTNLT